MLLKRLEWRHLKPLHFQIFSDFCYEHHEKYLELPLVSLFMLKFEEIEYKLLFSFASNSSS